MPNVPASKPTLTWWDSLLLFLGLGGKDRERYLILKGIKNTLKSTGRKYFHVGPDMAEPALAKVFHEIYLAIGPAQYLFLNVQGSPALKNIVIEGCLTSEARELLNSLEEEAIVGLFNQMPLDKVMEQVQQNLTQYMAFFTPEVVRKIEGRYYLLNLFLDLLKFNFYFFLKKFDSHLPERDFNYRPKFERIHGTYIADDLKDFWEVGAHLPVQADWDGVFDALKAYKNIEPVNRGWWKKVLGHFEMLQRTDLIPLIIQHVTQDPTYHVLSKPTKENLVEAHLNSLKTRIDVLISKLKTERRKSSISKLAVELFGSETLSLTRNYTEKYNTTLAKRQAGTFQYVDAINYLKAFLLDVVKKDFRELVNHIVIKGQWFEMPLSKTLSDSVHKLMEISDRLLAFDDSLAEEGERGQRIKNQLLKSERDLNAQNLLRNLVKDINGLARSLLLETANELIGAGKILKAVIEDQARPKHEVIANWKQIENSWEGNLKEALIGLYKKIFTFVQLLQHFIKEA